MWESPGVSTQKGYKSAWNAKTGGPADCGIEYCFMHFLHSNRFSTNPNTANMYTYASGSYVSCVIYVVNNWRMTYRRNSINSSFLFFSSLFSFSASDGTPFSPYRGPEVSRQTVNQILKSWEYKTRRCDFLPQDAGADQGLQHSLDSILLRSLQW